MHAEASHQNPAVTGGGEPAYFSRQVAAAERFYRPVPSRDARLSRVAVVAGGRETCEAGYTISRRTFPFYSIEFVAAGKGELWLGGRSHALVHGTIFSYGPGIAHEIRTAAAGPLEKYFVNFTGRKGAALVRQLPTYGAVLFTAKPGEILGVFEEITKHGSLLSPYADQICGTLIELLALKIAATAIGAAAATSHAFARYRACVNLMAAHFRTVNSLQEIAARCHVDEAYICRLFKRYGHLTPYQHLTRLKMDAAAELLLAPGVLVKEVAAELGFDDPFHFSRTFRRHFKVSPSDFIRMHQR